MTQILGNAFNLEYDLTLKIFIKEQPKQIFTEDYGYL